jgi:hypothetical protein
MGEGMKLDKNYRPVSRSEGPYSDFFGKFVDEVLKEQEAGTIGKEHVALLLNLAIRTDLKNEISSALRGAISSSTDISERRTMLMQFTNTTHLSHA